MIKRSVGENSLFTGGAEDTPHVSVYTFRCPGSLHDGDKTLRISQNSGTQVVSLSIETMKKIIEWAEKE